MEQNDLDFMSIMAKRDELAKKAKSAINDYDNYFNITKEYEYEILVDSDFFMARKALCNSEIELIDIVDKADVINLYHGLIVPPDGYDNKYYILLKEDRFKDYMRYYLTTAHEYTHLIDYFDLNEKYHIKNMRYTSNIPNPDAFHFYTEVRARYRSTLLVFKKVNQDKDGTVKDYKYNFLPFYEEDLAGRIPHDMYSFAQYYAQYLVVKEYTGEQIDMLSAVEEYDMDELLNKLENCIKDDSILLHLDFIVEKYNAFIGI